MEKIELLPQEKTKQTWSKPELELVSIKEQTLAGGPGFTDAGILS